MYKALGLSSDRTTQDCLFLTASSICGQAFSWTLLKHLVHLKYTQSTLGYLLS